MCRMLSIALGVFDNHPHRDYIRAYEAGLPSSLSTR